MKSIEELGTILGIWAHPDDEVMSSAGVMRLAIENGQKVVIVTATRGENGKTTDGEKWPVDKLKDIRTLEAERSLARLGDITHFWLEHKDGALKEVADIEVLPRLLKIAKDVRPDTIITFEREGITGHEDHKAVHHWAVKLAQELEGVRVLGAITDEKFYLTHGKALDEQYDIYFNTESPRIVKREHADYCYAFDERISSIKLQAIAAHESQNKSMFDDEQPRNALIAMSKCECFERIM